MVVKFFLKFSLNILILVNPLFYINCVPLLLCNILIREWQGCHWSGKSQANSRSGKSQGILELVREIWNFVESQGNLRKVREI